MDNERQDDVLYEVNPLNGALTFVTRGNFGNWCAGDVLRIAIAEPLKPISIRDAVEMEPLEIKSATFRLQRRDGNIHYAEKL